MPDIPVSPANPGNAPRRNYKFKPNHDQQPATAPQLRKLRWQINELGASASDVAALFGDQFRSVDLLSALAASWGIDELTQALHDRHLSEQYALRRQIEADEIAGFPPIDNNPADPLEAPFKKWVANHYRAKGVK